MKKALLILILVCGALSVFSETTDTTTLLKKHTWAIKGKALPFILIGSGFNCSAGVEYGFKRVNSIGIDFTYAEYSFEHDVYDSVKKEERSGPRMHTVVRGVFLNYRRYLDIDQTYINKPLTKLFGEQVLPYVGAFARYGKSDLHYEPGYATTMIKYDEWQYSAGVLIGVVAGHVDINIGPFYKQKYITDIERERASVAVHSYMVPNFGLRVGVNLFLVVREKSNHMLSSYAACLE